MNNRAHTVGGGLAAVIAAYLDECQKAGGSTLTDDAWARIVAAGGVGGLAGSLPDLLEPALHPDHRQFFHSVAFALALGVGMREVYAWAPAEPWQCWIRGAALAAGSASLMHLAMDATTPKSLPLLGQL